MGVRLPGSMPSGSKATLFTLLWRTVGPRAGQSGDQPYPWEQVTSPQCALEAPRDYPCPSQLQQPATRGSPVGEKRREVTLISGLKCRELMSPGKQGSTSLTAHRTKAGTPLLFPGLPAPSAHAAGVSCAPAAVSQAPLASADERLEPLLPSIHPARPADSLSVLAKGLGLTPGLGGRVAPGPSRPFCPVLSAVHSSHDFTRQLCTVEAHCPGHPHVGPFCKLIFHISCLRHDMLLWLESQ